MDVNHNNIQGNNGINTRNTNNNTSNYHNDKKIIEFVNDRFQSQPYVLIDYIYILI